MTDDRLQSEGWHAALASSTRRRVLKLLVDRGEALDAVAVAQAISLHVTTARFHLEQLEAVGLVQRAVLRVPGQRGRPRVLFSIPESRPDGASRGASGAPQVDVQEQLSRALISVLSEDVDGGRARAIRAGENWSTTLSLSVRAGGSQAEPARGEPSPLALDPAENEPVEQSRIVAVPAVPAVPAAPEEEPASDVCESPPVGLGALHRTHGRAEAAGPYLTVLDNLGFAPEMQGERVVALRECPFREEARANPGVVCSVHLGLMRGIARGLSQNEDEVGLRPFVTPTLCLVDLPGSREDAAAIKTE